MLISNSIVFITSLKPILNKVFYEAPKICKKHQKVSFYKEDHLKKNITRIFTIFKLIYNSFQLKKDLNDLLYFKLESKYIISYKIRRKKESFESLKRRKILWNLKAIFSGPLILRI